MRHLALLAVVYLLAAALVLPGSLLASDEPAASDPAQAGEQEAPPEAEHEAPELDVGTPADPPAEEETAPSETVAAEPVPPEPGTAPSQTSSQAPSDTEPVGEADSAADERQGDAANPQRKRARAAASTSVTIKDFEFSPTSVTIDVGDTVTWNNEGPTPHSATADDGSFDTGIYGKGESRSETFEEAGTFSYFCTPHPFMKASVTVRASDSGAGDDGGSAGGADSGGSDTTGSNATGSGATDAGADDGSSLPATGRDSGTLLVLGVLMLALGVAVQRRARTD